MGHRIRSILERQNNTLDHKNHSELQRIHILTCREKSHQCNEIKDLLLGQWSPDVDDEAPSMRLMGVDRTDHESF
jgi:hypothetical protein